MPRSYYSTTLLTYSLTFMPLAVDLLSVGTSRGQVDTCRNWTPEDPENIGTALVIRPDEIIKKVDFLETGSLLLLSPSLSAPGEYPTLNLPDD